MVVEPIRFRRTRPGYDSHGIFLICFALITKRGKQEVVIAPTHLLRKEVIHPHLPVRIPCYDLVLIANLAVEGPLHQKIITVTRFGRC